MADLDTTNPLQHLLADALPKDVSFTFYHYSTPPTKSGSLFSAPPNCKPERTYCESHFLAASITPKEGGVNGALEELLVLAIEVLVYTTKQLTTIFVSKADSTGYLSALSLPRSQSGSPLNAICGTFVSWLARERQREGKRLVVSLFARAQDQYLFPASIENKNKHVLDDRGLVKWWCRVLDPILGQYAVEEAPKSLTEQLANGGATSSKSETTAKGYLVVPGFDLHDTLRYLPTPAPGLPRRWAASAHPLLQIAPHPGAPPRCLVPHFPDDPKSRFLDELDEELPDKGSHEMIQQGGTPSRSNGQWKSVKTLDEFWEMMAFRQECASGRIVGFIWVVVTPPSPSIPEEDEGDSQSQSQLDSQESIPTPSSASKRRPTPNKPRRRKATTTDSGPIPLRLPRIKSSSSSLSMNSSFGPVGASSRQPSISNAYFTWPATSRGTIIFTSKDYDRAHETLLQQNFGTQAAAAKSTKRWKDEMTILGGLQNWGWTVTGRKETTPVTSASIGAAPVAVLGVRKKRKPDTNGHSAVPQPSQNDCPALLGEGLVRKKAKIEETACPPNDGTADGVSTLGGGLVRKKPKQ
ncbi:histone acetylation protein-domain-containing protein [Lophiotrema nucula]|uniref:histone acetyltransferase n=1 Tax=Lophiotrema nucula TaxID=690887 RepID=A0A6A5YJX0_9PLEO|nr:histone acetylation protein-domain-containing protein [Lophiotrema nucula]